MTIHEISRRYNVPIRVLRQYESWGGCSLPEEGTEPRQYDDSDLERLGTMMTLYGLGFEAPEVEAYMRLLGAGAGTGPKRLAMLKEKREATLEEIHLREKRLTRLDYLRYEIQKKQQEYDSGQEKPI